jgi:hypothetical protein
MNMTDYSFLWYHLNGDGSASVHPDTPEIRRLVNASPRDWYGNPEGTIIYGGVYATAFRRKTETVYDAVAWLENDERIPAGEKTTITITASRNQLEE